VPDRRTPLNADPLGGTVSGSSGAADSTYDELLRLARFQRLLAGSSFAISLLAVGAGLALDSLFLTGFGLSLALGAWLVLVAHSIRLTNAECPSCGQRFFFRVVSIGPFVAPGPWGSFKRRPSCESCGFKG
jgi:hypothetical protein